MGVVGHQRPGVQSGARLEDPLRQSIEEQLAISLRTEDPPPLDTANNDVMKGAGEIEARSARYAVI